MEILWRGNWRSSLDSKSEIKSSSSSSERKKMSSLEGCSSISTNT
jgi:hypothetical protein